MKIRTFVSIPKNILDRLEPITDNIHVEVVHPENVQEFILIVKSIKDNEIYKATAKIGKTMSWESLCTYLEVCVQKLNYLLTRPKISTNNSTEETPKRTNVPLSVRIRSHRNFLGLTLAEYAEMVDCSQSTLQRLETYADYEKSIRDKSVVQRIEKFIEGKSF